jgi:hypothetical protein
METSTPDELYRLYMKVLGRASISPQTLLPLIAEHLHRTFGLEAASIRFERGDELKKLDAKFIPAAMAYLGRSNYQAADDITERALRLATRKSA